MLQVFCIIQRFFTYISLSSDPYKYAVTTSIKRISKLSVTTKLIKNLNVSASTTYRKPCATSLTLYLTISFFLLHFRTNTHLYPTSDTPSNVSTTGQNTSRFASEFNFA
jgi:hypothetical protein